MAERGGVPIFKRALVKLSGEAMMGSEAFGIHQPTVRQIAEDLIEAVELGVEIAVVVGGGNIFRGAQMHGMGLSRRAADFDGHARYRDERDRAGSPADGFGRPGPRHVRCGDALRG